MPDLLVPARFNGPPDSGNGGWSAGALAALAWPDDVRPVSVRLQRPVPLESPMAVRVEGDGALAVHDDGAGDGAQPVLRAQRLPVTAAEAEGLPEAVPAVDADAVAAAERGYAGWTSSPFSGCFACGHDRPAGDGLALAPGRVPDLEGVTACTWAPGEDVDVAQVWAALDCPGGWSMDLNARPSLLGTMTAVVHRLPEPGEPCVVMGRLLGLEGRRSLTATTLWSGGEVLARAGAVWVTLPEHYQVDGRPLS